MTDEKKEEINKKRRLDYKNLSVEEKHKWCKKQRERRRGMTECEKNEYNRQQYMKQKQNCIMERYYGNLIKRYKKFMDEIQMGPAYICVCCQRCMFIRGVVELTPRKIVALFKKWTDKTEMLIDATEKVINHEYHEMAKTSLSTGEQSNKLQKRYMCHNCHLTLFNQKIPRISVTNGLYLDEQPEYLTKLRDAELQLIAPELLFMKIFKKPPNEILLKGSLMRFIKDTLINVPLRGYSNRHNKTYN